MKAFGISFQSRATLHYMFTSENFLARTLTKVFCSKIYPCCRKSFSELSLRKHFNIFMHKIAFKKSYWEYLVSLKVRVPLNVAFSSVPQIQIFPQRKKLFFVLGARKFNSFSRRVSEKLALTKVFLLYSLSIPKIRMLKKALNKKLESFMRKLLLLHFFCNRTLFRAFLRLSRPWTKSYHAQSFGNRLVITNWQLIKTRHAATFCTNEVQNQINKIILNICQEFPLT